MSDLLGEKNAPVLTDREKRILAICKLQELEKRTEINRKWDWGRIHFHFHWQSPDSFMGRFGGGWQWKIGIQAGKTNCIFNLLVCSLRVSWREMK